MTDKALTTVSSNIPMVADAMSLAEAFARSGFFSDATDAAKAIVKIQAGRELGIPPVAAMTGINIVQGRISLGANILAGLVKRHPAYDYRVIEHTEERCLIAFYQGDNHLGTSDFTIEDAASAGLASKQNWRTYPRNMLFARAMSNGVRWYCPDVTAGAPIYTPDELDQPVNEDGSMSLYATADQREAIREKLRELFPDVQFANDGHYNYILKRNGYPKLSEMTAEQATRILRELYHEGPPDDDPDTTTVTQTEPEELYNGTLTETPNVAELPAPPQRIGRDVSELIGTPEERKANLEPPTEWAEFWTRCVSDLGFSHKQHALNAFKGIFPHYRSDNMPMIAEAWQLMIQHQQEAGRL